MAPTVRTNGGAGRRDCVLFFLVLLCLPHSVNSMSDKDTVEAFLRRIDEVIKIKEYELKNEEIMSKLMHAAASLVNKDQLKTLKNELQQTGKEADRQQVEKLDRIEAAVKDFDETMKKFNSQKQANQKKAETESPQKIIKMVEDVVEKFKRVINKMGVSGTKAELYQKMLQEVLKIVKILKSS